MKTKKEDKKEQKAIRYFEGNGSRKTSGARVRISPIKTGDALAFSPKNSGILINGKDYKQYFKNQKYQEVVESPLEAVKGDEKFGVSAVVSGGGLTGQAEAIRHGIARALVKYNEELRKKLRKFGYMTRDARMVERKKYGLKKARRAPQWAKR